MSTVPERLEKAARIYANRNETYGDTYKEFGDLMIALHPDGIELMTIDDYNRFGVYMQILSKIKRYSVNFKNGGHKDSLDDLAVYVMMLQELDQEVKSRVSEPHKPSIKEMIDLVHTLPEGD